MSWLWTGAVQGSDYGDVRVGLSEPSETLRAFLRDRGKIEAYKETVEWKGGLLMLKEPGALEGLVLLLVDDDSEIREVFAEELEFLGAQVIAAADSAAALAAVQSQALIDIVISDLRMPRGDGLSLWRQLKAQSSGQIPAFVIITGYSGLSTEEADREGIARIFEKPLDWPNFTEFLIDLRIKRSSMS